MFYTSGTLFRKGSKRNRGNDDETTGIQYAALCGAALFRLPASGVCPGGCIGQRLGGKCPGPDGGETYLDWDAAEKKLVSMPIPEGIIEISATGDIPLSNGWYIVKGTRNVGRVTVSGDVHLILADGCKLTAGTGIEVNSGNSLTIYAQSDSGQ